ncbi:hypothetical protein QUC31_016489 [Theobroma cacao]
MASPSPFSSATPFLCYNNSKLSSVPSFSFLSYSRQAVQHLSNAKRKRLWLRRSCFKSPISAKVAQKSPLQYRKLGDSDLQISEITLGTMTFGEQNTEKEAHEMLSYAFENGINALDTAETCKSQSEFSQISLLNCSDINSLPPSLPPALLISQYPIPMRKETNGRTDLYIASWLKSQPRDKVILATKVSGYSERSTYLRDNAKVLRVDAANIRESVEKSLKRLNTDYIDLLQIHWPDRYVPLFGEYFYNYSKWRPSIPFVEQLEAFQELIDEGKVRYIGVSNETAYGVMEFVHAAKVEGLPKIVSIQNSYSLLVRRFEVDLIEVCHPNNCNIGLLSYSPLGGGTLSGKYLDINSEAAKKGRLNLFPGYMERYNKSISKEATIQYIETAKKHGLTPVQLALGFVRDRPFMTSSIIGATSVDQLKEDIDAFLTTERPLLPEALITLKKGTQLIKYSRKGKPKFRAFRLSPDETTLIWLSHGEERNLKLSSVSRIIPGQRTAVFRRYLRPEKEYLSFSLLYNNGERSLDLICKDKVEAEVWFAGLKALIGQNRNRRTKSDFSDLQGDFFLNGRPFSAALEFNNSIAHGRVSIDFGSSDVGSERASMQLRTSAGDGFRISVSSTPSCSSGGSGPDDIESLGDVYVWGEVWSDGVPPDGSVSSVPTKIDVLTPKPLESNVVLDVHQIACGARHIALVTKQGEVFTWGEESGGRLGHGIEKDFSHPRLVEFLAVNNVDFVACGEYHTCVVSTAGDLFTWGDGTHNAGLLGHGTDVSHWIPKRVSGALEGLQVLSIACGTWHSALATSNGKLFTFGDGKFGVLGHGDRESLTYPKEVQMLNGLKTIKVACGVWHTAAIVEVIGHSGVNVSSRKLFTWGDGDKHRLGHGSKETYLLPTCVSSLIDYNFHQIACGHTMTIALTTSGHVFTMGGTAYGQLGNPSADGKLPCLVQERLVGEFVEEISCGAYHVAVLTSRSEVFTWGRGANGRLGHGDTEDRRTPTLVEALKDRHVKNISCGSNFTSSICIHKWVSGADQSVCSGCRQAFGFTRKRHNCYNCGLVHCHACSSKKALKAALAPTPGKPHRVCDACYAKLKAAEAGNTSSLNRKVAGLRPSLDGRERMDRGEIRSSRLLLSPTTEPAKYLEIRSGKPGARYDSPSLVQASQVPSLLQLKDIAFPSSLTVIQNAFKPATPPPTPPPQSPINSRSSSPYSRRPSPPRSVTSTFSRNFIESLRKSNDLLKQEVAKLQNQMKGLKQKCDSQDTEMQKLQKNAEESASYAAAESFKCKEAKEVLKSITDQLKEITETLPPEILESETFRAMHTQAEAFLHSHGTSEAAASLPASLESSHMQDQRVEDNVDTAATVPSNDSGSSITREAAPQQSSQIESSSLEAAPQQISQIESSSSEAAPQQSSQIESRSSEASAIRGGGENELTEQFEPGVYITFFYDPNGGKVFGRVRFSKRRFAAHQAEEWWVRNKDRVQLRYIMQVTRPASAASSLTPPQPPRPPSPTPADETNEEASPPET